MAKFIEGRRGGEVSRGKGLTSLKLRLNDKCKGIKDFPQGEFYYRRKPKGSSDFSSLEERLADGIYELMNCLDTGIVTSEIKTMIKPVSTATVVGGINKVNHRPISSINNDISSISPNITNRSVSGWSGLKSEISSKEYDQMLLRDRVLSEIIQLKAKVSELDSTIQAQNAEIKQLKSENERLLCMHTSRYSSISCYNKSTTNSQHGIDYVVVQEKNLTMDFKTADSNDDTIQDIQDVLSVPSSKEPRSYKPVVASTSGKRTEGKSNSEPIKQQRLIQDTSKLPAQEAQA